MMKSSAQLSKTYFSVSFSSDTGDGSHQWSWQAAEIVVDEDEGYEDLQPASKLKYAVTVYVSV